MLAGGFLVGASAQATSITFTIENPGVQSTTVAGAITETFDSLSGGLSGYVSPNGGTYTGGQVISFDQYGGAGGAGKYVVSGLTGSKILDVTFASAKTYFGVWWSAGDAANTLEFYQGATLLNTFTVASLIGSLNSSYYGNPNSGQNPNEPYVYLNFTSSDALGFDKIRFINLTTSGFESDNHSTYDKVIDPPGNSIPDAGSTLVMLGLGVMGVGFFRRKMNA
jgi:hypothetical protein